MDGCSGLPSPLADPPAETDRWAYVGVGIAGGTLTMSLLLDSAPVVVECPQPPDDAPGLRAALADARYRRALTASWSVGGSIVDVLQMRLDVAAAAWPGLLSLALYADSGSLVWDAGGGVDVYLTYEWQGVISVDPSAVVMDLPPGTGLGAITGLDAQITPTLAWAMTASNRVTYETWSLNASAITAELLASALQWPSSGLVPLSLPEILAVNEAARKLNASATRDGALRGARGRNLLRAAGQSATLPAIDHTADNACRRLALAINAVVSGGSAITLARPRATVAYNRGVMIRGK